MKARILVVHGLRKDSRQTTLCQTLAFARHSYGCEVLYVHGLGKVPSSDQTFDLVVLTYEFLALRNLPIWKSLTRRFDQLIKSAGCVVLMPQDDYTFSNSLDNLAVDWNVSTIFSPITRDLDLIYPRSLRNGVKIQEALTGYVDESLVRLATSYSQEWKLRTLDLGQRVRLLAAHFGETGQRKGLLATSFAQLAIESGFQCDVSTDPRDVFLGEDWYKFLGNSRFTVGRLGGASRTDPKGKNAAWVKRSRILFELGYERLGEVAQSRITSGNSGRFQAISPRIFEAAAMGTCQILERDDYLEDMKPWEHYIPIDQDLSNVDEVFDAMRDSDLGESIAKRCADLLIYSNRYTYETLVLEVLNSAGITVSSEANRVEFADSSDELGIGVEESGNAFDLVQLKATSSYPKLKAGRSKSKEENLVKLVSSKELPVESMAIPWRSASSFV